MKSNNSFLLFWLSPVLGLISAIKDLKMRQSRITIFLFCLCFGFCFSVGTQRIEGSADGISMRMDFEENKNLTTTQFYNYLSDYFEFDTGAQDIYIVTMSFLVGRFTDNYHFFFLALAFVFAFFQIKCLKYFVQEENVTNSAICIILTFLFLWNNIYNINGARFWTATWIGLYCVFKIFYDRNPVYFLLVCCIPMVHASFAVFPIIVAIGYLLRRLNKPLIVLFVVSWIFSVIAEDIHFQPFANLELPFVVAKKVDFYTDPEYIKSLSQGTGFYWVNILFKTIVRHYIDLLILIVAINSQHVNNEKAIPITRFMLILASIANFGMFIPTFGNRFFVVNYALVAYSFIVTFGDFKYRKLVYALPFVWFMNLFYLYKDVTAVLDFGFILPPIISIMRNLFIV